MMENSKPSQRGEISRLAMKVKAGVFVGTFNARVRDKLWKRICEEWQLNAIMLYSAATEQGYRILVNGNTKSQVINCEGIYLLSKPTREIK